MLANKAKKQLLQQVKTLFKQPTSAFTGNHLSLNHIKSHTSTI